jgi:hypothetical protein
MADRQWKVIGRGLNGWHAATDDTSLSGAYAKDAYVELARSAVDGALVYDAENAGS